MVTYFNIIQKRLHSFQQEENLEIEFIFIKEFFRIYHFLQWKYNKYNVYAFF